MGNSILYRMPSGIPGDSSRPSVSTIEPAHFDVNKPFPAYGVFGKVSAGKFVPVGAGDTAAVVYGLLVRPYPATSATNALGVSVPPSNGIADVMRRGYMTVKLNAGTSALGGQVYVRVAAETDTQPIGGIEAVADSTNTIAITGATFMSEADASGNVEIAYNI